MVGFFLCKGRMYLYSGRIFIQMDMNWELFEFTEKWGPETLRNSSKVVGRWAICLLLSLGSSLPSQGMSWSPQDGKGAERGKKLWVEKIMQGKEAGKWHMGKGRRKNKGSWWPCWGPPKRGGRPEEGPKNCVEILGMQEILEPFFSKNILMPK